jgi:hypothetical protein
MEVVKQWTAKYKGKVEGSALTVTGHTDSRGPKAYNQRLSERRAGTLARILKEQGVEVPKDAISGRNFEEPVGDNKTRDGRAANRRAEVGVKSGTKFRVASKMETALDHPAPRWRQEGRGRPCRCRPRRRGSQGPEGGRSEGPRRREEALSFSSPRKGPRKGPFSR